MKKLLILFLTSVISLSTLAQKLYVGTNAEFAPYEYLENGKLTGFDVELMELIGKNIGYEIIWRDLSFDGLIPALQTNKIDAIIAGMSPTEDRKKAVEFSNPYLYFKSEHLVLSNKNSSLKNKSELNNKIVGAQLGSIQEGFAKDLNAQVRPYNSFLGALMDLDNNKIDAVIISDKAGHGYLDSMKNLKVIDTIIDNNPGASIALQKGDTIKTEKINKALDELKNTDAYNNLVKKYFPEQFKNQ